MLLADVRKRLESARSIPLRQLAAETELTVDILINLLQPWLRRGRLRLIQAPLPACATRCGNCSTRCSHDDVIEWLG